MTRSGEKTEKHSRGKNAKTRWHFNQCEWDFIRDFMTVFRPGPCRILRFLSLLSLRKAGRIRIYIFASQFTFKIGSKHESTPIMMSIKPQWITCFFLIPSPITEPFKGRLWNERLIKSSFSALTSFASHGPSTFSSHTGTRNGYFSRLFGATHSSTCASWIQMTYYEVMSHNVRER